MQMTQALYVILLAFLGIAIVYAMVLNYRLSVFQDTKKEMLKTVQNFRLIVEDAEHSLSQMQKNLDRTATQLQREMKKAALLRDDLALLLDATRQGGLKLPEENNPPLPTFEQLTTRSAEPAVDVYQSEAEKQLQDALKRLKRSA